MTVNQLLNDLTYKEMLDWSAFFRQRAQDPEPEETDWSDPAEVAKAFKL